MSAAVALVLLGAGFVFVVLRSTGLGDRPRNPDADAPAAVARGTALPPVPPLSDDLDLGGWADRVARPTGIPARALAAYGAAERRQRLATP
jgi:hypothetical protein